MNKTSPSKWFIDVMLFTCFLVAFFLDQTGLELHQWIGVAAGALATYHLITHWAWISTVTERFFGKTSGQARLYYLIDVLLFSSFYVIGFTGLMISSWLNLSLTNYNLWLTVHIQSSIAALGLTVLKVGLHWRWIVTTAKKIFSAPGQPAPQASAALRPAPIAATASTRQEISRRDFLKMMSAVGVVSLFALGSAASGLQDVSAGQENAEQENRQSSQSTSSLDTSTQSCSIQCNRNCSYPGHCQRYVDSNGNNHCDHSECI